MAPSPIEELRRIVAERRRWNTAIRVLSVLIVATLVNMVVSLMRAPDAKASLSAVVACSSLLVVLSYTAMRNHYPSKNLKRTLDRITEVQYVGPLLEGYEAGGELRSVCRIALIRLLSRLNVPDRALLSDSQLQSVSRALLGALIHSGESEYEFRQDAELAHACLSAIEQIGGDESIPALETIVYERHGGRQIVSRASELLALLRERAEQQAEGSMLLRPAEGEEDRLLRPATARSADPATLLRVEE